jgi:heme/copper-type cytochrome/quinol oxidase subunit 1
MCGPGMTMHRLPLFVWYVLVTTFLILLSLLVLVGVSTLDKLAMPWSNLTICWELCKDIQ